MKTALLHIFEQHPDQSFTLNQLMKLVNSQHNRVTVYRHLRPLVNARLVKVQGRGRSTKYKLMELPSKFFNIPYFQRPSVKYNEKFLLNYDEQSNPFFTQKETAHLIELNEPLAMSTTFFLENKRVLELLLIDFAYTSSYLEGNTYSHLDTQVLIESGQVAEGKHVEETTMVLNHKYALEYVIAQRKDQKLTKHTIFDIHSLLGKGLIDNKHLGVLRDIPVKIGASAYTPPQHKHELESAFQLLLEKYNTIRNPFEQSFFILVYTPYLQMFYDINKRTGRTLANLPLLRENLAPFTYLGTDRKEYLTALLSIYELQDFAPMKRLYLEAYELICKHYFAL